MSDSTASPFLSVIIPAYNEEKRLPATLEQVQDYLAGQDYEWEVLVVDDGSKDRTIEVAEEVFRDPRCRVVRNPRNMGKGATIRNGMMQARGELRLFTDADNSTPIEETGKLVERMMAESADVAVGSRAIEGANVEVHQPFYREWMGRTFNLIVQLFALRGIKDTQCGFKIFTKDAAEYVFPRQQMDGFSFDVEVLFLAQRKGFKIVEVPVRWINSPASRVSPLSDSAKMFVDVMKLRFRKVED
ncbi:glycosyltransferase family 2 protein [bacterium]|nr:glycosyltransferase family 2 protein [bacterium]